MIIDKEVEIRISPSNLKYYKNLGYDVKSGLTKVIKVNDLSIGSNVYINVKCCYCNNIKKSTYKNYLVQTKIVNKYSCSDCGHLKKIDTVRLKYGVDYKVSVLYGYVNNIDMKIISDISNLCITKKYINSKKSSLNEYEFKSS